MAQGPKKEIYGHLRVLGIALVIPVSLAVGPVAGYFLGSYLVKKFSFPIYILYISITLGFFSGFFETIQLIKFLFKGAADDQPGA
jgi:hypothetical protein